MKRAWGVHRKQQRTDRTASARRALGNRSRDEAHVARRCNRLAKENNGKRADCRPGVVDRGIGGAAKTIKANDAASVKRREDAPGEN